jgi:hypothetical protein
MTSRKKILSNRSNAKLSTGPSDEALGRTRFNGLKHSMRAQTLLLPAESPLALEALRERWFDRLNPRDQAEADLVSDYVKARWFHQRAERSLHRYLKADIAQAAAREDEEVASDIRTLFADARGHHSLYAVSKVSDGGPTTSHPAAGGGKDAEHPCTIVNRLESSEKGCLALIGYWKNLRTRLVDALEWQPQDRLKAIRMLGWHPLDVLEDQRILIIYTGCFALHPAGKSDPLEDLKCEMSTPEAEPFLKRARTRWPLILDASETAKAKQAMFDLVDRQVERLEAKAEAHRGAMDGDQESPGVSCAGDASLEVDRLRRYELASDRRAKRCLDAFYKFRREMGEEGGERNADDDRGHETDGEGTAEGRTEDGGRRAEDGGQVGGRRTEGGGDGGVEKNTTDLRPGSVVGEALSNGPEKNLATEANTELTASKDAGATEVAPVNDKVEIALAGLSGGRGAGLGWVATRPMGGGKASAAIEEMIFAGGPLMRPTS